jgi:hypothetical protein
MTMRINSVELLTTKDLSTIAKSSVLAKQRGALLSGEIIVVGKVISR